MRYPNGFFEGDTVNGKADAFGVYIWKTGSKCIGEWKNGWRHGKCCSLSYGSIYFGDYVNDKLKGKGEIRCKSGDVYVGGFKDDLKEDYGKYTRADGRIFKGFWKNGNVVKDGFYINDEGVKFENRMERI